MKGVTLHASLFDNPVGLGPTSCFAEIDVEAVKVEPDKRKPRIENLPRGTADIVRLLNVRFSEPTTMNLDFDAVTL